MRDFVCTIEYCRNCPIDEIKMDKNAEDGEKEYRLYRKKIWDFQRKYCSKCGWDFDEAARREEKGRRDREKNRKIV